VPTTRYKYHNWSQDVIGSFILEITRFETYSRQNDLHDEAIRVND
jgi:hypothetical protein